jgi:hypothetical protein
MTSLESSQRRLVVGISGASGVTYSVRLLQLLRNAGVETHLVMSRTAEITFAYETNLKIAEVKAIAHSVHAIDDMAASGKRQCKGKRVQWRRAARKRHEQVARNKPTCEAGCGGSLPPIGSRSRGRASP